jgi:hypothetical protein
LWVCKDREGEGGEEGEGSNEGKEDTGRERGEGCCVHREGERGEDIGSAGSVVSPSGIFRSPSFSEAESWNCGYARGMEGERVGEGRRRTERRLHLRLKKIQVSEDLEDFY